MSEISTKLEAAGLRVKPLEWTHQWGRSVYAETSMGTTYVVEGNAGKWRAYYGRGYQLLATCSDKIEATAVCASDNVTRILAALEAAP